VIIVLENSVHCLFPVPLGAQVLVIYYTFLCFAIISQVKDCTISLQIVQLTAASNFEEALSLCKLLPPEDSNLRAAKEGSIHIRFIAILDYSC